MTARAAFATGILIVASMITAANGQAILPNANVFVGYSYENFRTNPIAPLATSYSKNFNGFEVSGEGQIFPFLGIVADFSSHYGNATGAGPLCPGPTCPGSVSYNVHDQTYLFGPRASVSVGKITPFAQALFGVGRLASSSTSNTSFATAIGGGADWKIAGPFAWRVQGDYLRTKFFGDHQNNFRASTGLVFRF